MILMEILSGPLCRGRFEVPSKYVAISAICLRENRLHLRSGGCNTSRGKHHRGDCLSMAREHKRAIVALCCFHHFDIQKSHGFDPQSQSFSQSYGMLRIWFPDDPSTTRVNPHSAQFHGNPTPSKSVRSLQLLHAMRTKNNWRIEVCWSWRLLPLDLSLCWQHS